VTSGVGALLCSKSTGSSKAYPIYMKLFTVSFGWLASGFKMT